jgi:hypothetical protein
MAGGTPLETAKELHNPMGGDGSTPIPLPLVGEVGEETENSDKTRENSDSISKEDDVESPKDATEYPKGANLAFIRIAIILSIFLASLDMVGHPSCAVCFERQL